MKAGFITGKPEGGPSKVARDGQLVNTSFDDDWEDDYPPQAKPDRSVHSGKKGPHGKEEDSDFVTDSDSEDSDDNSKPCNKKEDPRNRIYL